MTASNPDTSDRALAAEIYTRRIRNTVFGAILLVAWLILLFKELGWGLAVGVLAGALYILFLLGRWIVRVCTGRKNAGDYRPAASRFAPAAHYAAHIEPMASYDCDERDSSPPS